MTRQSRWRRMGWGIPVAFLLFSACHGEGNRVEYTYRVPAALRDGWRVASLADVGLRPEPIADMMEDLLNRSDHLYHSVLIVRDGSLVLEEYFAGEDLDIMNTTAITRVHRSFDAETLHFQASVTKSVTSALFGVAVDRGWVPTEHVPVFDQYPDHTDLRSGAKAEITLTHMLTMSSGLAWDESSYPYDDPRSDTYLLLNSPDPVRFMLEKPLQTPPGSAFLYNSGTTNVLGDVVRRASGQLLTQFAAQHLFGPLGIDAFEWKMCQGDPQVAFASGGLYLKPRAMAKLGQLYLQAGVWDGRQVVSTDWIRKSTSKGIDLPESVARNLHATGYGYQWWLETYQTGTVEAYSARGWGNQYIVVLPRPRMVVVFTGGAYDRSSPIAHFDLLDDHILASVN